MAMSFGIDPMVFAIWDKSWNMTYFQNTGTRNPSSSYNVERDNPAFSMDIHNELSKSSSSRQNNDKDAMWKTIKAKKAGKSTPMDDYLRRILMVLDRMREDDMLNKTHTRRRGEWMLVAYVIDRFLFVFFILSASFVSAVILCQYLYNQQEHKLTAHLGLHSI